MTNPTDSSTSPEIACVVENAISRFGAAKYQQGRDGVNDMRAVEEEHAALVQNIADYSLTPEEAEALLPLVYGKAWRRKGAALVEKIRRIATSRAPEFL